MANTKPKGGLTKWFKEDWVDIGSRKKKGKYQPCGRKSAKGSSKRKYPKCVPKSKAGKMTTAQKRSAVPRKRAAGNPGGKPTRVRTIVKKKSTAKTRKPAVRRRTRRAKKKS